jgi:hypothetical protein
MNREDLFQPSHVTNEWRKGRNLYDGYARGLTLWGNAEGTKNCYTEEHFEKAIKFANRRSLLGAHNFANFLLVMKFYLPQLVAARPCAIVEFGVARGGSLLFLASLARDFLPGTRLLGFDTFEGIPPDGANAGADWHVAGDFAPPEAFDEGLASFAGFLENVELVKGRFEDTVGRLESALDGRPIALCHIDCDTRDSVALCFEATRPFMLPGGYWIFDDPLHASCLGAMEAVEDVVIRGAGLNCEQNYPHLVFRAPL